MMMKPIKIMPMFSGLPKSEPFITASENSANTKMVIRDWNLGPEKPNNLPNSNTEYWKKLGESMQVNVAEARRRRCSNCEYYNNSTDMQLNMERIPQNQWDVDAGFRGFCEKFDFICHDLRSCQAWEPKEDECD